jgi:RND family efflux transporter MFP subunit
MSAWTKLAPVFLLWPALALAGEVPAVLQWSQRVELSPRVSGVVEAVNVQTGERVKAGQALVVLDNRPYRARLAETEALLAREQAEAAEARRDLGRVEELYRRAVIATGELDAARLKNRRAQAQAGAAAARLAQQRRDFDDTIVRAPFEALVVERRVEPGQNVVVELQPQPVLVLARAGEMVARLRLYESQMAALRPGQAVEVGAGGRRYAGQIKTLGLEPAMTKDGPVYAVDVLFQTADTLRAGGAATVKLP